MNEIGGWDALFLAPASAFDTLGLGGAQDLTFSRDDVRLQAKSQRWRIEPGGPFNLAAGLYGKSKEVLAELPKLAPGTNDTLIKRSAASSGCKHT